MGPAMKYQVIAAITLHAGAQLILSEAQAQRRKHLLEALGDGLYQVRQSVQFKAGETIETDQDLPKHLASLVEAVTPAVSGAAPGAKQPKAPRAKAAKMPASAPAPAPALAADAPAGASASGDDAGGDSGQSGDEPQPGAADAAAVGAGDEHRNSQPAGSGD